MPPDRNQGNVIAVCLKEDPGLPKSLAERIRLVKDHGVEGDYHAGKTIRHRYLVRKDPTRANNRQVLLVDTNTHDLVNSVGITLQPGDLGENLLLDGVDLMALKVGTRLEIGSTLIELTEVREPCGQLDGVHPGLEETVRVKDGEKTIPRAGMLGIVLGGGVVKPGDPVRVVFIPGG